MSAEISKALVAALDGVFAGVDRGDAPGLVVGIASQGRTVYRRGFGLASVRHGVANEPNTRMRIASISKQFTCLAILLLAEDGKLDIDAPADRYLPNFASPRGMPTLRHMMTHTSGIRCSLEMGTLANGCAVQPPDWQSAALRRQSSAHFAPNQGQMYCNGAFTLLTEVIDRLSGMSYENFLKTRIFEPIDMHDTDSVEDDTVMVPGSASLHVSAEDGRWRRPPADTELRGDGGTVSTVDDMLRWMAHLNGPKRVGSAETWRQMLTPVVLDNGLESDYAMGLKRTRYRGLDVVHHSGGLFGLNSEMLTVPGHGLDVMIMVNGAPVSAVRLAKRVVDTMLHGDLGPPPRLAAAAPFSRLIGVRYVDEDGFVVGFEDVEGTLSLSLSNMAPAPVIRDESDSLRVMFDDVGIGPYVWNKSDLQAALRSAPDRLPVRVSGNERVMTRMPADAERAQQVLQGSVGRYRSPDLAADAEIECDKEGLLRIRGDYSGWRTFRLTPFSGNVFGIADIATSAERYVLSVDDGQSPASGFWIDTYRARRLRFDRITDANASFCR